MLKSAESERSGSGQNPRYGRKYRENRLKNPESEGGKGVGMLNPRKGA
jgi:hypothetical protein